MKKLILTFALILTCSAYTMQAQRVSVNIKYRKPACLGACRL